jgi:hypothetical protein
MFQYLKNIILASSKLLRAFIGGNGAETLSQATARGVLANKWWCVWILEPLIDWFFWLLIGELNHVKNSISGRPSQGKTIWDWGK